MSCLLCTVLLQKAKDAWISFIKGCEVLNVNEVRGGKWVGDWLLGGGAAGASSSGVSACGM